METAGGSASLDCIYTQIVLNSAVGIGVAQLAVQLLLIERFAVRIQLSAKNYIEHLFIVVYGEKTKRKRGTLPVRSGFESLCKGPF